MYKEVWYDSDLAVFSSTKYPSTDTPVFQFPDGFENASRIQILEAIIPNTFYNIVRTLQDPAPVNGQQLEWGAHGHQDYVISFYNPTNGQSFELFFEAQYGSFSTVLAYLQAYIATPSFKTDFDNITGLNLLTRSVTLTGQNTLDWVFNVTAGVNPGDPPKFAVAFDIPPTFNNGRRYLARLLGFRSMTNSFVSGTNQYTYSSQICQQPFDYFTVHSKSVGAVFAIDGNFNPTLNVYEYSNAQADIVGHIPCTEPNLTPTVYQKPASLDKFVFIQNFSGNIDFYISYGPFYQAPLVFNGASFKLKIAFETIDEALVK